MTMVFEMIVVVMDMMMRQRGKVAVMSEDEDGHDENDE